MMPLVILAQRLNQQERIDALRQWSDAGGDAETSWAGFVWILVCAAIVVGILYLASSVQWRRERKPPDDSPGLFKGAMSHLRLELKTRAFLSKVASDTNLDHPVRLLMSPRLFDEITQAWLNTLPRGEAERQHPLLDSARAQIYGGTGWQALKDEASPSVAERTADVAERPVRLDPAR